MNTSVKKPIKLALLEQSARMGGVQFSTLYLVQSLDRNIFHPTLICPEEGYLTKACRESGADVVVLPGPKLFAVSWRFSGLKFPNPVALIYDSLVLIFYAFKLASFLSRGHFNLVCTKGLMIHFGGGLAARLAGIPCVWHLQDFISNKFFGFYILFLKVGAVFFANHIICDGASIIDQLPSSFQKKSRVSLIHNGIDLQPYQQSFNREKIRQSFGFEKCHFVIGNVARMTLWKGQHLLIEAFKAISEQIPNLRLLLIGAPIFDDGKYESGLKKQAERLGILNKVVFGGFRTDLPDVLATMDLFVYPSVEKDTCPLVLVSAMVAGKPTIASDLPGIKEMMSHNVEGLLFQAGDAKDLALKLKQLVEDPEARRIFSVRARQRAAREFNIKKYTQRCTSLFLKVVNHRGCAPQI